MNKTTKLQMMVLVSGRTPKAICKEFQRRKWTWDDKIIKKFIAMSTFAKRKDELLKEMDKISKDTLSIDC